MAEQRKEEQRRHEEWLGLQERERNFREDDIIVMGPSMTSFKELSPQHEFLQGWSHQAWTALMGNVQME